MVLPSSSDELAPICKITSTHSQNNSSGAEPEVDMGSCLAASSDCERVSTRSTSSVQATSTVEPKDDTDTDLSFEASSGELGDSENVVADLNVVEQHLVRHARTSQKVSETPIAHWLQRHPRLMTALAEEDTASVSVSIDRHCDTLKVSFANMASGAPYWQRQFRVSSKIDELLRHMRYELGYAGIVFHTGSQTVPEGHRIASYDTLTATLTKKGKVAAAVEAKHGRDPRYDFGPGCATRCSVCRKFTRNRGDADTRTVYCVQCFLAPSVRIVYGRRKHLPAV